MLKLWGKVFVNFVFVSLMNQKLLYSIVKISNTFFMENCTPLSPRIILVFLLAPHFNLPLHRVFFYKLIFSQIIRMLIDSEYFPDEHSYF